jgi:pimeloyl-ACP methyl ester carboxylesterase
MSAVFSFPLLLEHPQRMAGFVPVAPARAPWLAERLEDSPVPALVVWGGADRVFPASQAETLAGCFRDARVVVVPGAGHPVYLDEPEAFHEALLAFLERVSATKPPPTD